MDVNNIHFTKIELQITKYLFKHYKDRFNARQLARILTINHAHANKLCNILADKELLTKEELGNSTFYNYKYDDKLAIKFIEYLLSLEKKEIPEWLIVLSHNLKKFNDFIELGLIFGSSIKSKNFNDIDVLLMYTSKNTINIKKIKEEIRKSGLIEKPIRSLDITSKDILINKDDKTFYSIISDNIIFYDSEKYVEVIQKCRK